jgi:hypothetical protein
MTVHESARASGWLAGIALAVVSLFAGIISYNHALDVVRAAGAHPPVAYLVPFLADFVILGASASLLTASRAGQRWPRWDVLALAVGVGMTLAMNVAAGDPAALPKWLVDAWPAVAFVLALESLAGMVRRGRGGAPPSTVPATQDACPHGVAASAEDAVRLAFEHGRDCLGQAPSYRQLAARFGIDRNKVPKLVAPQDAAVASPLTPDAPGGPPRPPVLNGSTGGR